jgi:hypothetical protein
MEFVDCSYRTIGDKNKHLTTKFKLDYFNANLKLKINPKPSSLNIGLFLRQPHSTDYLSVSFQFTTGFKEFVFLRLWFTVYWVIRSRKLKKEM